MRVAIIQLAYDDTESLAARTARVVSLVESCRGADLVVLPELWSAGGFSYWDWEDRAETPTGAVAQELSVVARSIGAVLHGGSIVERSVDPGPEGKSLWNTSLVFDDSGSLVATYRKIHRFGFGSGEPALMEAGSDLVTAALGGGLVAGLSTCYDLRFPELYRAYVDRDVSAFVIPAAWPAARIDAWRNLLRARAIENECFVFACNTAGTHAKTRMGGYSAVVAPTGQVLAEAGTDEEILSVDIDPGAVPAQREAFPVLADRRLRPGA